MARITVLFTGAEVNCTFFSARHLLLTFAVELKELIALHSSSNPQGVGGDLRKDTVTIIGATLDLQEKVVSEVSIFFIIFVYLDCLRSFSCRP